MILDHRGNPMTRPVREAGPPVRARYDAAQTDHDNYKHWSNADNYSARAANDPQTRRTLRNRSRYERANNSYFDGITQTLSNDTIGTGPRLQVSTPDADLNQEITEAFEEWACATSLAEKLRIMRESRTVDGEAFALMITNPSLPTPVQLDLDLVEADQIATPYPYPLDPLAVDGLRFDKFGNPTEYHMLRSHPGDLISWGMPMEFDTIPAKYVIHYFRSKRPRQYRGIPDVTAALPLFAQLRRYTLAVLAAAETAADFAALLKTSMPAGGEADEAEPFETLDIVKRMMTTLPAGWDVHQLKAEQPTTTFDSFTAKILNEIARCLNIPYNIAAGNSSGYNYSSGRLDHQTYYKSIGVDQSQIRLCILDRIFAAWVAEARMTMDLIPAGLKRLKHAWFWDGMGHVDPVKDANAEQIRLAANTTTLADAWARQGHDWREKLQQRAEELAFMRQLGLPNVEPPGEAVVPNNAVDEEDD